MIMIRLMGGLGNQMFQYAFGKSLALKHNVELKMDVSLLGEDTSVTDHVLRNFDLDIFKVKDKLAVPVEIERFNGKANPSGLDRIIYKFNKWTGKYPLVLQRNQEYDPGQISSIGPNACVVGRWQSENFFRKSEIEIREIFSFEGFTPNLYSAAIAEKMKASIAVSVHVRRRDYVTHPVYSKTLGCLDKQYYLDALALMNRELGTNVKYYFISDDIEWCKANFKEMENAVFVEQQQGKNGYASDLWLLTQCRYAVISNSTFSWWGAWLGEKMGSVIIAPGEWSRQSNGAPANIVPERWEKIRNGFVN